MSRTLLASGLVLLLAVAALVWWQVATTERSVPEKSDRPTPAPTPAVPVQVPRIAAPRPAGPETVAKPNAPLDSPRFQQGSGPVSMKDLTYSVDLQRLTFEDVRQQLLKQTGLSVVLDPSESGTALISIQLKDATMDKIFSEISKQLGVPWRPAPGGAVFTRKPKPPR